MYAFMQNADFPYSYGTVYQRVSQQPPRLAQKRNPISEELTGLRQRSFALEEPASWGKRCGLDGKSIERVEQPSYIYNMYR